MDWLQTLTDALAGRTGLDPAALALTGEQRETILEIARVASHSSGDRRNAPLLCYVLGIAAASGVPLDRTVPAATELAEAT